MRSKPVHISKYLFLKDLLEDVKTRNKDERRDYFTSRLANIKLELKRDGIEFEENIAHEKSTYSTYKPYELKRTFENITKAKELLKRLESEGVKQFLASA